MTFFVKVFDDHEIRQSSFRSILLITYESEEKKLGHPEYLSIILRLKKLEHESYSKQEGR